MKIYIPEIGDVLTLAEHWTFPIVNEQRNAGLAKLLGVNSTGDYYYPFGTHEVDEWASYNNRRRIPKDAGTYTFLAGTSLEVDRIYVRKGNEEFSSVTFKTRVNGKLLRFFVKREDANRIVF